MGYFTRAALVLASSLLLSACFLTPGKFTSTLDIRADRSFAFTYKGEVIAVDMDSAMNASDAIGNDVGAPSGEESVYRDIALRDAAAKPGKTPKPAAPDDDFSDGKDSKQKMLAIAAALSREKGFRTARYLGDGKFEIDYAIAGTLDHAFVFPFNVDAKIIFPFVAVELRGDDRVRVKAPGFANDDNRSQNPMGRSPAEEKAAQALDGSFTLTTNAMIVSQNQEEGPASSPQGHTIVWKVDPLTTEAPMAVIKFPAK
ncbi:hypothetical protein KFK14_19755 [Sphingobium phenoxybenzoativorans]|uniref:Uncharacterized protein n=1 Tax=Sphingobium phenoxybenzoativorans TaxID=1592790 RepID=A0A975K665_9SPHN|nr:hypothetical protein [Sphingobium phenoxybenzoativorans]QUT05207.1 hypothetical protein KFK14_19755 [Sphingobium phenoxybenzoativorans]